MATKTREVTHLVVSGDRKTLYAVGSSYGDAIRNLGEYNTPGDFGAEDWDGVVAEWGDDGMDDMLVVHADDWTERLPVMMLGRAGDGRVDELTATEWMGEPIMIGSKLTEAEAERLGASEGYRLGNVLNCDHSAYLVDRDGWQVEAYSYDPFPPLLGVSEFALASVVVPGEEGYSDADFAAIQAGDAIESERLPGDVQSDAEKSLAKGEPVQYGVARLSQRSDIPHAHRYDVHFAYFPEPGRAAVWTNGDADWTDATSLDDLIDRINHPDKMSR